MGNSIDFGCRGISKRYGAVHALDGANLELRAGETMALLGENGAGKSTMMKVLAGLVTPDTGSIVLDGAERDLSSTAKSQDAGIAVVQQEYSSVPTLSIAENLFLGERRPPLFTTVGRQARAARRYLDAVGLDVDPRTPVARIGVAERQLVEIARVLARDAEILLFDEPTAALSDAEIERVLAVITRLADEGRSIVYVTHRLGEVFRIADRITVFRNGRSLDPVATGDVTMDDVIASMLGRQLEALFPERGAVRGGTMAMELIDVVAAGLRAPVNLQVRRGEILGLTGQMGSGAGATVRALAGTSAVAAGTITIDGAPLPTGRQAGIRRGVAYCSADRKHDGVFGQLPIAHNLTSPWLTNVSRHGVIMPRRERAAARKAAEQFAIDTKRLGTPVDHLSGGNQQKVALGKWLAGQPDVVLVEEPTRGVDIGARAEIYRHLRTLCEAGLAVVVASSDQSEILGLSDTVGAFFRGELVDVRPAADWPEADLVAHVMHGGPGGVVPPPGSSPTPASAPLIGTEVLS